MAVLLLAVIYITFISLGLPDTLLGSAWPVMHKNLGVPLSYAGILSMAITTGTIVSSFMSGKLIKKFGTGKVILGCVIFTVIGILGFSLSPSFIWLLLSSVPYGLGAGSIDSALNNFVAVHYKAKQMSWLHCFWGVGATMGPNILAFTMAEKNSWRAGYTTVAVIQGIIALIIFLTLSLWKNMEKTEDKESKNEKNKTFFQLLRVKGVKPAILSFFAYCAAESSIGLWGSSYLVSYKFVEPYTAAKWVSLFYMGIMTGRFLSGFAASKIDVKKMIIGGIVLTVAGVMLLVLPMPKIVTMLSFAIMGLGSAPIFPCMAHDTPRRFGIKTSQEVMGIQLGFAYMGVTFMPPFFGFLAGIGYLWIFPFFIISLLGIVFLSTERINQIIKSREVR